MSEIKFGAVDWNTADAGTAQKKADFMRLEQGANVVRVMSRPSQFYVNWVETPDGRKRKINTPVEDPALIQRLEDEGFKRQARWIVKVLDRRDGQFKLLEIGSQIFLGIKNLFNNPEWGPVNQYDITINRGRPGQQPLYSVLPSPKKALDSSLEGAFREFNDSVNLERLLSPSDPQYVYDLMGWQSPSSAGGDDGFASDGGDDGFEYQFE